MPYLDTATLVSNHSSVFADFNALDAQNTNLFGTKKVTVCFHGTGGNAANICDFVSDAAGVNYSVNNLQYVIAPKSVGFGGSQNGWWPNALSFAGISPTNTDFAAAVDAGVALIDAILAAGVPMNQIALVGHSQGGALALEVAMAKLDAFGPNPATPPDRFAVVMLLASGCVGMFQEDQTAIEAHAWWQKRLYGQNIYIAAKAGDPTVPEKVSAYTADHLARHCGADVTYRVETVTNPNTHDLYDGGFATEQAYLKALMV